MKKDSIDDILFFVYLWVAFLIIFMIYTIISSPFGKIYERNTHCYDKFSNEIKNTVCKECYQYTIFNEEVILEKCEEELLEQYDNKHFSEVRWLIKDKIKQIQGEK